MKKTFKVWVTKDALRRGIEELEVKETSCPTMVVHGEPATLGGRYFHGEGREWHTTKESAVKKAQSMLEAKIKSLEKQLGRFRKMTFQ